MNCPCKNCLTLVICRNKDEIRCKLLYQYVVSPNYHKKRVILRTFLKKEALWFKARDWCIGFVETIPFNSARIMR